MNTIEYHKKPFSIKGIKLSAVSAAIYKKTRPDLVLIALAKNTTTALVSTKNKFAAAPVVIAKKNIQQRSPRFLIINAGNANAGTGKTGLEYTKKICAAVVNADSGIASEVLPFSTGVIGEQLPVKKICSAIPTLFKKLAPDNWIEASKAMMTTDTVSKTCSAIIHFPSGEKAHITGMAKGSGMIQPNMATMLGFIATDVTISSQKLLQSFLHKATNCSFNRISVDGETSTNDACALFATGASTIKIESMRSKNGKIFLTALSQVMQTLAKAIVLDGEGATKFITIQVYSGKTKQQCLNVARLVANSPLVKTACFASDPNWGRIIAAIGNISSSNDLKTENISLYLNQYAVFKNEAVDPLYREERGVQEMNKKEITWSIHLGNGKSEATIWTCDLSYDYVKINSDYRS